MADEFQEMSQRYTDLILRASGDGVYGIDTNGFTLFANPAAVEMCGYTLEEMVGRNQHELIHHSHTDGSHYPVSECPIYAALKDGEVHTVDTDVFWRKDGTSFPVEYVSTPIIENGEKLGAVISFRDITKRRDAEAALAETRERARVLETDLHHLSRLSAMGEMASELAHEVNQPLTAIASYASAAKRFLESDQPDAKSRAVDSIQKVVDQALRAGDIIRQLREFVVKGDSTRSVEDVAAVVTEAANLAALAVTKSPIVIDVQADASITPMSIDKIRIQQVVVNLVRNAFEAFENPTGGRVDVFVSEATNGDVDVTVRDNGPGLNDDVRDTLFQAFVTSKESGMGIGLSICRSIIEEHGGSLVAEENALNGMTFKFSLPRSLQGTAS